MKDRIKTAVLISGRGSNMTVLAKAATAREYPAKISLVVSNRPGAQGLETAKALGIKTVTIDHHDFAVRTDFEQKLQQTLTQHNIELVVLAGFMRKLTAWFTSQWENRMINIHPSLLPKYKGLNTHARAIEAGDDKAGCTVHYVTAELDSGPVLLQQSVPVLSDDTPETLSARVLVQEHLLFPKALAKAARALAAKNP